MIRGPLLLASLLCAGAALLPARGQGKPDANDAKGADLPALARSFLDLLAGGDYPAAVRGFDATMARVLPPDKLEQTWKVQLDRHGKFKKLLDSRTEKVGKYDVVHLRCAFENQTVDARVVFDGDRHIAGLFFVPEYEPPAYADRKAFRESEVTVGSGDWAVPGTLALPAGAGPFPGVVLLQGSGPNDRDETLGPNKPCRDLAWGLASRGMAVLRFDKRTRAHAAKLSPLPRDFTIKEEVLDDALAAVALLRKTDRVDGKKVFVLGHSLGAVCAPTLAVLDPQIAGVICLAGTTRPLEVVLVEQLDYILSLGGHTDEQKQQMEKTRRQAAALIGKKPDPDAPAADLPLGLTARYLLSLRDCEPSAVAPKVRQPVLILQGERDYQATMQDFMGWMNAFRHHAHATFKSYPTLNHLFMPGTGKARPAEYAKPGHVDRAVIDDICEWVKRGAPP